MASETYHVSVSKDELVFSAGHFITYNGDVCERLHGHNYRVTADVWGPLDSNHYVIDFILLRDTLRRIVAELDHHMLLPTEHPLIRVTADSREVEATFQDRRWVFPRQDCILLPIPNTTTELIAHQIAVRLRDDLRAQTGTCPERLRIAVDECFGQIAAAEIGPE